MRSVLALGAMMATSALAKPLQHQHAHAKRDVVIVTDIEYVYQTQWVTAGASADATSTVVDATDVASSTSVLPTTSALASPVQDWSFGWWTRRRTSTTAEATTSTTEAASSTSVVLTSATSIPAPTTTSTPAPITTSTPTKVSTTLRTVASSTPIAVPTTTTTPPPAPTTTSTTSTTAPAATSAAPVASGYAAMALAHHNVHRANHSAPAATWNDTLASIALTIANSCQYEHNVAVSGGGYGQNIAAGAPASQVTNVITDLFYNGEVNWFNGLYGAANPDMTNFEHWGHFSQIVWKESTSVGCATVDCSAQGLGGVGSNVPPYFTVCNYFPAGNMGGGYGANIGASLGKATVVGTDSL